MSDIMCCIGPRYSECYTLVTMDDNIQCLGLGDQQCIGSVWSDTRFSAMLVRNTKAPVPRWPIYWGTNTNQEKLHRMSGFIDVAVTLYCTHYDDNIFFSFFVPIYLVSSFHDRVLRSCSLSLGIPVSITPFCTTRWLPVPRAC